MCCSFLFILIIYGALGGFLFGYDLGCITAALPIMLNDKNLSLTDFEEGERVLVEDLLMRFDIHRAESMLGPAV